MLPDACKLCNIINCNPKYNEFRILSRLFDSIQYIYIYIMYLLHLYVKITNGKRKVGVLTIPVHLRLNKMYT